MAGGTSPPNPSQLPLEPNIATLQMRCNCIIPNGPAFTVDISGTSTVRQLKSAIKVSAGSVLDTIAAAALKLYQINIDGSNRDEYIKEVQRLAQSLDSLTRLSDSAMLCRVFPSHGPLNGRIHILVDGKLCMLNRGLVLSCLC